MRLAVGWSLLGTLALALGACGSRAQPYRFASPMIGTAELAPARLGEHHAPAARHARRDPAAIEAAPIRVVSAPVIREASAAAADAILDRPASAPTARAQLPAPHRAPPGAASPPLHIATDLRALVGIRDARDPLAAVLAWSQALGRTTEGITAAELLAWADRTGRIAEPSADIAPGDLLVFDHAVGDDEADLLAIAIARDDRGVTECLYLGGGVIRRGFVDPARPAVRRDPQGAVVNTYLRHGKRWPAKGTHYLAGELIAHVIHTR